MNHVRDTLDIQYDHYHQSVVDVNLSEIHAAGHLHVVAKYRMAFVILYSAMIGTCFYIFIFLHAMDVSH